MTRPVISQCPLCGEHTQVTEVQCPACDIQIKAQGTLSRYDRLSGEQGQFLETFLRCRGVIRDMEAALGISYPTVRARLDGLLETLSLAGGAASEPAAAAQTPSAEQKAARRKDILAAISAGTMDAQSGLDALQDL